tara:strand:+ start:100 stop:471 length:372 start_codon:yes stop_codon:yes gene_type:complete
MAYYHANSQGNNARTVYVNYVDGGGDNFMGNNSGVSSTTDHGTGDFTVNFALNFSNTHYLFTQGCSSENTNGNRGANGCNIKDNSLKVVGSCRVASYYGSTGSGDGAQTSCKTTTMVFTGDIA